LFGRTVRTHLALEKALVIACLDDDLLGSHPAAVRCANDCDLEMVRLALDKEFHPC